MAGDEVIVGDVGDEIAIGTGARMAPVSGVDASLGGGPGTRLAAAEPLPSAFGHHREKDDENENARLLKLRVHEGLG